MTQSSANPHESLGQPLVVREVVEQKLGHDAVQLRRELEGVEVAVYKVDLLRGEGLLGVRDVNADQLVDPHRIVVDYSAVSEVDDLPPQ